MAIELKCKKCGTAMALAETLCSACGQVAPLGRSALLYMKRAQAAAEGNDLDKALTFADKALKAGFEDVAKISALQRKGSWHERRAEGDITSGDWREAENCYRAALEISDADEKSHQLWIANLAKASRGEEAVGWYDARLVHNQEDEIAVRFLSVARLTMDYQSKDLTKDYRATVPEAKTALEKVFKPSRINMALSAITTLVCAGVAVILVFQRPAEMGKQPLMMIFLDPVTWFFLSFCCLSFFGVLWWMRR